MAAKKKYLCYINSDRTCSHTNPAGFPLPIEWYPKVFWQSGGQYLDWGTMQPTAGTGVDNEK